MNTSSNILEHLFNRLNEREIGYVILRRYDKLPKATLGGDIDIYVIPSDFDECISVCNQLEFSTAVYDMEDISIISNIQLAIKGAIDEPKKAIELLITSPDKVLSLIQGSRRDQDPLHRSRQLRQGNIPLHICDHLSYTSPYDGSQIRVDKSIEQSMFDHRRLYNGVYVPSPPDELAHIIPHCVFDKNGYFSNYYMHKCDALVDKVTAKNEYDKRFRELLSDLFYNADKLVYESVISGEYDAIFTRLYQYNDN